MRLILAIISITSLAHAAPTYKTLNYHHGNVGLELTLSPRELMVIDRRGVRSLHRATCNAKVVKNYWDDLGRHVARLKPASKSRQLAASSSVRSYSATLKADQHLHQITMFDPTLRYFDRMAKTTDELFIADRRACRGRK